MNDDYGFIKWKINSNTQITMNAVLISIFIIPAILFGQSSALPTKTELTKIYSKAIGDFIKAANKKNKMSFDTLFFGKRTNGQADDFPDIKLPELIEHTQIRLINTQLAEKKQKENKARIYINLVGWVNKERAEFIFIVFSNGFAHQYDYYINYKCNKQQNEFSLDKLKFKGPPFDK